MDMHQQVRGLSCAAYKYPCKFGKDIPTYYLEVEELYILFWIFPNEPWNVFVPEVKFVLQYQYWLKTDFDVNCGPSVCCLLGSNVI